jgi:PHD/YefM family antitoxin component YafN of YafNO toxin-antitoxin module
MPEHAVTTTRRGRPVPAILPWEFYEGIIETLEILGDPEMVKALRESFEGGWSVMRITTPPKSVPAADL